MCTNSGRLRGDALGIAAWQHHPARQGRLILLVFGFWFLVCYAVTQLAIPLHLEFIHVVCSNRDAQMRLADVILI